MQNEEIQIIEKSPSPEEYNHLRTAVGWHHINATRAQAALNSSLFSICAITHNQLIGFGRVVGDGAIYFYIQDIIVLPSFQKQGIGHQILQTLLKYVEQNAPSQSGAFIGLMSAPNIAEFYHQYGFNLLPENSPFMGLWKNGH